MNGWKSLLSFAGLSSFFTISHLTTIYLPILIFTSWTIIYSILFFSNGWRFTRKNNLRKKKGNPLNACIPCTLHASIYYFLLFNFLLSLLVIFSLRWSDHWKELTQTRIWHDDTEAYICIFCQIVPPHYIPKIKLLYDFAFILFYLTTHLFLLCIWLC